MLNKLPPEILDMIAESVVSKEDLKSLSLVSRTVHRGIQRTMWSSLDLWPICENTLWALNHKPVFKPDLPAFLYATELNFKSTFDSKEGERCPHWRDSEDPPDPTRPAVTRFATLRESATSIVEYIPPRRLRKFTWAMGTCVPESILGRRGILARTQPQLSSLDLTTAGDCLTLRDEIDLSRFEKLTQFRWRGPRMDDFDAITDVLKNNCKHMTDLELDFIDWYRLRDHMDWNPDIDPIEGVFADRYFHEKILGAPTVLEKPLFPALVSLSLTSVPLLARTARAFDFTTLQSLTIRKCPNWDRFLAEIPKLGVPLRLKSLEVHQPYGVQAVASNTITTEHDALLGLITSFTGLEELFLSLVGPMDAPDFWDKVVKQHGPTLKRFTHNLCAARDHPTAHGGTPALNAIPDIYDIPDFDLALKLEQFSKENPLRDIYRPESIGLSCIPEVLGPIFSSFSKKDADTSSLKLIHIRQSSPVINRSGSWATKCRWGNNPTILLPTIEDNRTPVIQRFMFLLTQTIYGMQLNNSQDSQNYDTNKRNDEQADWEREAELITETFRENGPILVEGEDVADSDSSRYPSPLNSLSPFSTASDETHLSSLPEQNFNNNNNNHKLNTLQTGLLPIGLRDSLVRFANWAFGPHGIPSLEVIAFGDFGHGRWDNGMANLFLVKNEKGTTSTTPTQAYEGVYNNNFSVFWPGRMKKARDESFCRLEKGRRHDGSWTDQWFSGLLERNRGFLEACPVDPLVDYDLTWGEDDWRDDGYH